MELNLTTPAVLFPAISLLMLAYTNRYLSLASRVRSLYDQYKTRPDTGLLGQIASLRRRINLIKNMQLYGVLSFLFCVASILTLFEGWTALGTWIFVASLVLMMVSLVLSTLEIQQSVDALNLQLQDLEDGAESRETFKC
ncbi:MAG: DUF2721 domain-containing protein [Thermaceae bacterium]|nr:DUF2721 domain-containing protein [Thermaceae bacterium]